MSLDEQQRWDERYRDRGSRFFPPEPFLVHRLRLFRPGTVLDVACGDGRHALYLAKHGFAVTGLDFSSEALRRVQSRAVEMKMTVRTVERNLETQGLPNDLERFNNVIIIHYKPSLDLFRQIARIIQPRGVLLMTSFNESDTVRRDRSPHHCYTKQEFVNVEESLDLMEYISYEDNRGNFDGYVFQKKP